MKPPVRSLLAAALAFATAPAMAQTFSQTVFFGDSLTDSGFFRPLLVENAGPGGALVGRFINNPGLVWSEHLAGYYGTDASSAWGATSTGVVMDDGTNYAIGGARVGVDAGASLSLATQVNAYLARTGGQADANALYTVWGGSNDLFAAAGDPANAAAIVGGAVTAQVGLIAGLQTAGARYILVPTLPDIGSTPAFAANSAQGTALSTGYNTALFQGIAANGLRVIPLDTFNLLREITASPAAYGFTNVTTPLCTGSALTCVSPVQGFLFADGVHPTAQAHEILAGAAISVIEAPRQIAAMTNSATVVGRSRAERVFLRASEPGAEGMHWWADVRGNSQRYDDGDQYDGMGPTLTFGVDWTRGSLVYGAFAGHGRQSIDWGHDSGGFDQNDTTLGGYLGWRGESGGWANAQVSWTRLDIDSDRDVRLGPVVRTHSGSTEGENLSAGVSAGWSFGDGALRHGPVLAVLAQRIDIDGFAENNPALSTSLAYPEQSFDSLIGSAGWQASYAINDHLRPYARVTIDREFEDHADEAWARSQSVAGSAGYAVPGLRYDQDYGTVTFGARTRVFGFDADLGASTTINQDGGTDASVFLTVGSAF